MKYLPTITDKTIFKNPQFGDHEKYSQRNTVKVIVKNSDGKIALVINDAHRLYTLPGGGAESENLLKEISRECIEEIGHDIVNVKELIRVKEIRNRHARQSETVCFVADLGSKSKKDKRTEDEKNNNLRVEWLSSEEISSIFKKQIEMHEKEEVGFYNTAFNIYRDNAFWEEFLGN